VFDLILYAIPFFVASLIVADRMPWSP